MQQLGDEAMTEEKNVKSLEKALDIIEIVSNEQQDASLSEIARQTGLPKSTVHRLIATLTGRGNQQSGIADGSQTIYSGTDIAFRAYFLSGGSGWR